jgi:hypothetical protein
MAGKLKPLDVERKTKLGKYADGDGLYLIVTGVEAKNWSFRYGLPARSAGTAWDRSKTFRSGMPGSPATRQGSA